MKRKGSIRNVEPEPMKARGSMRHTDEEPRHFTN